MVLTPAERQRRRRERLRAGEVLPSCSGCGAALRPSQRQRPDRKGDGLCWSCWAKTPAGRADARERRRQQRELDPAAARAASLQRVHRARLKAAGIDGEPGPATTPSGGAK
ncbi:hypothetical protein [Synechococcus sp. EJ6-Ellesmere]|uniref:hypothetical protein n=1 Tax=Synechococcus sp. EJ6-Ellesmere TaxID=2823734 RepID=UPI0020CE6B51|nr:hypothetical protein [Synechococcus sp. EJ6-Ellesmere]MCP9823901.1 hypothetical protein [Synechococcus sp. EJ6-Ellesmere]